jgi:hypothetical protein
MAQRDVELEQTLDGLREELDRAHKAGAISYYHIGKVPSATSFISEVFFMDELFDVYIALEKSLFHKEPVLKAHIRKKYGAIVRVLVVELG